jgi:heterodisulfide reductase subunit C
VTRRPRIHELDPADPLERARLLADACVVPEPSRCVQCGICTYNCPAGIDVRRHAWRGLAVHDASCVTCGECVRRCPREVLRFGEHAAQDPVR